MFIYLTCSGQLQKLVIFLNFGTLRIQNIYDFETTKYLQLLQKSTVNKRVAAADGRRPLFYYIECLFWRISIFCNFLDPWDSYFGIFRIRENEIVRFSWSVKFKSRKNRDLHFVIRSSHGIFPGQRHFPPRIRQVWTELLWQKANCSVSRSLLRQWLILVITNLWKYFITVDMNVTGQ